MNMNNTGYVLLLYVESRYFDQNSCHYTLCICFEKLFDSLLDTHPPLYIPSIVTINWEGGGEGRI